MPFKLTINPGPHLCEADAQQSVLQSALDAGFMLPYGCRDGACGSCKGRVLEGRVDHGRASENTLSLAERAEGLALFCCAKPLTDLAIQVREVRRTTDIPIKKLPCRVQALERPAPDVMVLTLKLPANDQFRFLAGQYIDFLLAGGKRRSFSIANAPEHSGEMELHIRLVPGGQFTEHVFNTLKERDILRFEGPLGSFFLREDAKPVVMVAGGTGFAPMKGIIEHLIAEGAQRPVTLYWGARDRQGLYMHDLAQQWTEQLPGFKFVPVISDSTDDWNGRTGLVHKAALEDFPDMSGVQAYVCGAPPMVDAARVDFAAAGLPEAEFFADSFSFSADAVS
ncbi:CDP-6-deoxy-delta-3,4-glucoseen reductase [Niveibacterium sp. SC-1]|uniref:CDP-6-deoxy-delta-3,4-glucoseen reductase n=1 Tax=Niveibacterium sp. SC-1 TaxID=3135646 RepID=UPI00311D476F